MAKICQACGISIVNGSGLFCDKCEAENLDTKLGVVVASENKKESTLNSAIKWGAICCGGLILLCVISAFIFGMSGNVPSASSNPNDPNAFRTAMPTTPTPLPTPTVKQLPKFSRGDIVTYEPVTSKTDSLYIILNYDSKNDGYDTTFIHRNDDGSWGHWTFTSTDFYFEREKFEKNYNAPDTWIYGHVDPNQIHCEPPKPGQDPDFAKFFPCTRN